MKEIEKILDDLILMMGKKNISKAELVRETKYTNNTITSTLKGKGKIETLVKIYNYCLNK